jgi:hypothetical protein
MTGIPRVLFSCVAENRPSWFRRVQNLVLSIREFGGHLAGAPIVVNLVEGADPRFARWLERAGAAVRVVDPVDTVHRYANKLRMLELHEQAEFDVLVALDCDVVVLGDVTEFLATDTIGAKPVDCDMLTDSEWHRIFGTAEVRVPARTMVTTSFGQPTYRYVNSGVLLVPRDLCAPLRALWSRFLTRLRVVYDADPGLSLRRKYNDQLALTCAIEAGGLPIRSVPVSMNFPTHIGVHPAFLDQVEDVRVVHYHTGVDRRGFVVASRYPSVNRRLDRFNRRRAEILRIPYGRLPSPSFGERVRRRLAGQPWYHTAPVERVKGGVKETLAVLIGAPPLSERRVP